MSSFHDHALVVISQLRYPVVKFVGRAISISGHHAAARVEARFIHCAEYYYPVIGDLPVGAIDEPLVLSALRPVWSTKNVTARRIQRRLAAIFDYAAAAGYRGGLNPARWKGHLEHLLATSATVVKHHDALPYAEMPSFVVELRNAEGSAARALEFAILTAARTGEVRGATWDEIDLDSNVWVIPAARMKSRVEHRVPLSRQAVELLRGLPREGKFVFVGPKAGMPIGENAMRNVLKPLRPGVSVHGCRASFRTFCEEQTLFPNAVIEQSLAHAVASGTEKAYRRTDLLDLRRRLMAAWADFSGPISTREKVTPLRRSRP